MSNRQQFKTNPQQQTISNIIIKSIWIYGAVAGQLSHRLG